MGGSFDIVTMISDKLLYTRFRTSVESRQGQLHFDFIPVYPNTRGWNAAVALNWGIERATSDWVILAHQDILIPDGWPKLLQDQLSGLPEEVAVAGLIGIRPDGRFAGHLEDPHGHSRWAPLPAQVVSMDEVMIIVRRTAGLRFDEQNPGFHCYGTDISLEASRSGYTAAVIDAPVVHLSGGSRANSEYEQAIAWLLEKWGPYQRNVISTCSQLVYRISPGNLAHLYRIWLNRRRSLDPKQCRCACAKTDVSPFAF